MLWILILLCCVGCCGCSRRCHGRRRLRLSDMFVIYLMVTIFFRSGGHVPVVPLLACIAMGYFLRKIEEERGNDCCSDIPTEELEEAAGDE